MGDSFLKICQPLHSRRVGVVGADQCGRLADLAIRPRGIAAKSQAFVFKLLQLALHLGFHTCDHVLDQLWSMADLLDLLDHEIFNLFGRNRLRWTGMPAAFLGGGANVITIAFVAGLGRMVGSHGDLVDHDAVNFSGLDVADQCLERRTIHVATCVLAEHLLVTVSEIVDRLSLHGGDLFGDVNCHKLSCEKTGSVRVEAGGKHIHSGLRPPVTRLLT